MFFKINIGIAFNLVTLHRAPLVAGWVTILGWVNYLVIYFVTSHPGQINLAIPPSVGRRMSTSLGWEGNRRSGGTLAIRHSGLSTYGLNSL